MNPAHHGDPSPVRRSALSTCCSATLIPAATTTRYDKTFVLLLDDNDRHESSVGTVRDGTPASGLVTVDDAKEARGLRLERL